MKKLYIIAFFAALVGLAGWADPRDLNGQSLYGKWQEINKPAPADEVGLLNHAQALEYYSGYVDALACFGSDQGWYQIPTNASYGQLYTVVGKWLENHPSEWNKPASYLVYLALKEAFPASK